MKRLPLAWKIAAVTSLPLLAVLLTALMAVNSRVASQQDRTVRADLLRAALSFETQMVRQGEELQRIGAVVASDPKFFAMLTVPKSDRTSKDFHRTLYGVAGDFQRETGTPIFDVTDEEGVVLVRGGRPDEYGIDISRSALVSEALAGRSVGGYLVEGRQAYRVASQPIFVGGALAGTLCMGRSIDADLARALKKTTRSDVVFTVDGEIVSSTIRDPHVRATLRDMIRIWRTAPDSAEGIPGTIQVIPSHGEHFLVLRGLVQGPEVGGDLGYVLLRSLDQETAVVKRIGVDLSIVGGLAALLALVLSLGVAAGVTRPVRRLVKAANEMRVGNYDFPLDIHSRDELGALARDFDAMRAAQRNEIERLEEIDRMKSNFITVASHEIITPVTTIRAYADMMAEGAFGEVTEPQRETLSTIRRGTETLTRLARDLTNMSLIERHRLALRPGPCDLGSLIEEVATQLAPFVAQRNQHLSVVAEPGLHHPRLDREYLTQAILNIAMNAVRFTPDEGSIELGARSVRDGVEITVRDTGIGIAEEDQDRIFAKLVELKDVNLHSSGTVEFNSSGLGLGLSIARGIVEAQGGTIRVESRVGAGSIFRVLLPMSGPPVRSEPEAAVIDPAA